MFENYASTSSLWLLTINGINRHGRRAPSEAARQEGDVERGGPLHAPLAQVIQVGKEREVDDGEGDVPGKTSRVTAGCKEFLLR